MMNNTQNPTGRANFISPNEALHRAQNMMLEGRSPESRDDWALVFNSLALNIGSDDDLDLNISILQLMKLIYEVPLTDEDVTAIAVFQFLRR